MKKFLLALLFICSAANASDKAFFEKIDKKYTKLSKEWAFDAYYEKRKAHVQRMAEAKTHPDYAANALKKRAALKKRFGLTEEETACHDFLQDIKTKFKGDGLSPLENQLIMLDIEYSIKKELYPQDTLKLDIKMAQEMHALSKDPLLEHAASLFSKLET